MPENKGLLSDLWNFMKVRKRWWLLPLLLLFALAGLFIILAQSSALSPYLYALF